MLEEILKLTAMPGVSVNLYTHRHTWEKDGATFTLRIEREVDGEEFKISRTGTDLSAMWAEVQTTFWSRISSGYSRAELQTNLIEGPRHEEIPHGVTDDGLPF